MRNIALLTLLIATPLISVAAQERAADGPAPTREGFYLGLGIGSGSILYWEDFVSVENNEGVAGHLALGGTLNPHWLLGGETDLWLGSRDDIDTKYGALLGTATFYPSRSGDLFLKGGLGVATYREKDDSNTLTSTGPSWIVGVGWDHPLSDKTGFVIAVNYVGGSNWRVDYNGAPTTAHLGIGLVQAEFGVIWH